jgi:FAD/FMN-containing dehydrogenase
MSDRTVVRTNNGTSIDLDSTTVAGLAASFEGQVLRGGEAGYDDARRVWNAMIDRRPAVIARCTSPADVSAAVRFARVHDLLLSVKGGGHNVAGHAVCDGGLLIDLSLMRGIRVDHAARTVRVEAGSLWHEVDAATQAHGLATTGGTVSHTGVAGLTLGGGLGWLMARHGLACDNLLSANVVMADGSILAASESENADLFWALRGGGGNFGIVTDFEFRLHAVGPTILGGMRLYPLDQAREVLRFYRTFSASASDDLTAFAVMMTLPNGPQAIAIACGWFGDPEAGEAALAPVRAFGTPMADMIGPIPYLQLQQMFDAAAPHGISRYWKSGYFHDIDDALIEVLVTRGAALSPMSALLFFHMHGVSSRVAPDATAFAARRDQWDIDILTQWIDTADADAHVASARAFWDAIAPHSAGVYVNHLDADDGQGRVRAAFGANHARLAALKRRYDPDNVFRHNCNILPAS